MSVNVDVNLNIELSDEQRDFVTKTKDYVKETASDIWSFGNGSDEEDMAMWCLQDIGRALERLLETGNPCE